MRLTLEELRQPYRTQLVDRATRQQKSAAYLRLNPSGLIPVLETPQGPLSETAAILLWLTETHAALAPQPGDPLRGPFLKWLFMVSNTLHADLRIVFYPQQYVGLDHEAMLALHAGVTGRLKGHFALLEALVGQDWFGGAHPSILDFYVAATLRWAALYAQGVLRFSVAGVATATLVLFVEDTLGATVTLAGVTIGAATLTGLLLALRPLLSLATAPTAGRLSDIHGRWRMLNWGGMLGGVSFLVLVAGSLLALLVNGVLSALSMAILSPVSSGLVGDVSPPGMQGRNLGWLANAADLGSALGPLVAYALLPVVSLDVLYLLCAGLMTSVLAASIAGKRAGSTARQPNC